MCTSRPLKGYTLVEVLVAMVILALASTVLMRIFSAGLQSVALSSDYAHAVLLAESQLAAAGAGATITPGETSGIEGTFHWTRHIAEYIPQDFSKTDQLPVPAYQVTVVVEWPNGENARRLHLSTIKLDRLQSSGGST